MTVSRFSVPRQMRRLGRRRAAVTGLTATLALGFGPAAFAQEPEEQRSVRVLVLGDERVEVHEDSGDGHVVGVRIAATNEEKAQEMIELVRPTLSMHFGGAYLGIELIDLNEPLRAHFGVPEGAGVLVSNVVEDSPAARAGIQVGDILTRLDGEDVTSHRRLTSRLRRAESGDPADFEIWRDGKVETLSTTLAERPRPALKADSLFFLRGREDLDGDGELDVFVGPENLHERIQEYFNGDEWKERHEHLQRFLHERRPEVEVLDERFETLRKRLVELELKLERRLEEQGLADDNEN